MKTSLKEKCVKEGGLYHIYNVSNTKVPDTPQDLVQALPGPTVFHVDGILSTSVVITALIRGNEPHALGSLLTLLQNQITPAFSMKVIVISVDAARRSPVLSRPYLPGSRDLNRCFREPFLYQPHHGAHDILQFIETVDPDCVINFHDNPVSATPLAMACKNTDKHRGLASYFCREMMYCPYSTGAITNLPVSCPVISVYLPVNFAPAGSSTFYQRLLAMWQHYPQNMEGNAIAVIPTPKRLELKRSADLAFADKPVFGVSCTLTSELQDFDRRILSPGDVIGWVDHDQLKHFRVVGDKGTEQAEQFFCANDNCLKVITPLKLYILALHPDIAKSDCLFYFSSV
ncbi:hypothetical protein [Aestuariibacter sp. A3R04]|uniref:hypothetical protein n=1 Tax=Aestuariibacter sp. A3R04 TaxID=2841571 RepID=UPI001C09989D|nr:hypothetical protein [Aestuariibacter sp. A3R04]MBU3023198.1 hypothetical protein [Aestuariibacter sp. A3R04]